MTQQNITTGQARQRLEKPAEKMKDKDIQEILNSLYFLCDQAVQTTMSRGNIQREHKLVDECNTVGLSKQGTEN